MAPKVPVPDYSGAASTPAAPSSSSGNDIWGLGDVYGQPVYLGTVSAQAPVIYSGDGNIRVGAGPSNTTHTENKFGTTQDIMEQAMHLWSAQKTERSKTPDALTGYEQLQQALYSAGFFGQTAFDKIHVGQWTTQTQKALTAALTQYEQTRTGGSTPITFTEFLTNNAGQNGDGGFYDQKPGGGAQAPQVNLADPTAVRAAAQSAAMRALGQGLSSDQLDKFVAQFQAASTAAQTSTAGSVTTPDLSGQAMAFAQQSDPGAYQANQRQTFENALVNLLTTSGAQRPGMTPVPKV